MGLIQRLTHLLAEFCFWRVVGTRASVSILLLAEGHPQFFAMWASPKWLLASSKHASQEGKRESASNTEVTIYVTQKQVTGPTYSREGHECQKGRVIGAILESVFHTPLGFGNMKPKSRA